MAVQYSQLVNKNGTIYNIGGATANTTSDGGYATPDALAKDLGISSSQIQWGSIQQNANYNPATSTPPPGVDKNTYNSLSPADKAFVQGLNTQAQNTYTQGQSNYSINAETMQKALELAQKDPLIKETYGDQAKMALSDLKNNLGYINKEYAQQYGLTTAEQALQRKQLLEAEAAAGRAQSGFRNQAQSLQKKEQQAVIQSSQRALQQQVRTLGSQYESQFGSKGLPTISAGGYTYTPYKGITGSQNISEQQAIQQKQQQEYQVLSNPLTQQ